MNKLMPIIILSLLLVTCTACTKNSKLASNSKDGSSTSAMV